MASNGNVTSSSNVDQATCAAQDGSAFFITVSASVLFVLFACKAVHYVLNRLSQPRLVSEIIVGLLLGNVPLLKSMVQGSLLDAFKVTESFCASLYFFVLGLEMEPAAILHPPGPEAKIAVASIASTLLVNFIFKLVVAAISHTSFFEGDIVEYIRLHLLFDIMISSTSSPIVTRLITQLKLGQSEIGRTAVRAGLASDLVCTLLFCLLASLQHHGHDLIIILGCIAAETLFVVFVIKRFLFRWVNERNPEGRPLKGLHVSIIVVCTQILCQMGDYFRFDSKLNSFLVGLALPRQGRVSNLLISKINYMLTALILPLYISMVGLWAHFQDAGSRPWFNVAIVTMIAIASKILGVSIICSRNGLHWLEAVTLGMVLSIKGYFQIIFTMHSLKRQMMSNAELMVMLIIVVLSICYVPPTVLIITKRVRKIKGGSGNEKGVVGLQWYNPESELRISIGIHDEQNIAASMAVVELMRAGSEAGVAVVYCTDLIELTEQKKAALVYRQDNDEVMVADEDVVKLREEIGKCLDSYLGGNMTVCRSLALSSFSDMHDDICCNAQDNQVVFILLPFHKSPPLPQITGADAGHSGYRIINQNVLQNAPCSVGILVDRGLGHKVNYGDAGAFSSENTCLVNVVIIFMGGADDREALACASMMARHPLVSLKVIRIILPDDENDNKTERHALHEREMDNECIAWFYQHYVKGSSSCNSSSSSSSRRIGYVEKRLENGVEVVNMLKEMEGEQDLCIVGQGQKRNSVLTTGLNEWAECPELGPVGDILAGSDSPLNVSVLVIRQHNLAATDDRYIDEEFVPF